MKKKEKEIHDSALMEEIINRSKVCRLGLSDGHWPYVVPLCFGYRNNALFVHSALKGKKIKIIKENPRVCFELDIDTEIQKKSSPCRWGTNYRSIIGYGQAQILEGLEAKRHGLDIIMAHYSDQPWAFPDAALSKTAVIKVTISEMTGKQSGYQTAGREKS